MKNKKQTAVEWLVDRIKNQHLYQETTIDELEKQAKEIEKQKNIDFIKWIGGAFSFGNISDKWYSHEDTDKEYTEEELYQIYLKENEQQ